MISCNCKLVSFFYKSLNKLLKDRDYIQGHDDLNLGIVVFQEFQVVFTVSSFVVNPVQDETNNDNLKIHNSVDFFGRSIK